MGDKRIDYVTNVQSILGLDDCRRGAGNPAGPGHDLSTAAIHPPALVGAADHDNGLRTRHGAVDLDSD